MPMADENRVELHYASEGIADRILAALRASAGPDQPVTPDALAPLDHFHGRGLPATREMVALLAPESGDRVLDIGCGIGGPARWIAATFGCHVTGVDLTEAFCKAAEALTAETGMSERVRVVQGNALDLPFEAGAFDRAYSQYVVMNIADKMAFYREALRVLRPGGVLALSNIAAGPEGEPYFPVPWAQSAATSFLSTPEQTRADLEAAGFEIVSFRDTTPETRLESQTTRERIETKGLPELGMHVLMGARMKELQLNSLRSIEDGRTATIEALARKAD